MPIYHQEPENDSPPDLRRQRYQSFGCQLVHFGPIHLYRDESFLDDDIAKLTAESFEVRRLDAASWRVTDDAHDALESALTLPVYYGRNLDALDECMRGLAIPDDGGLLFVLHHFDGFAKASRTHDFARGLLDVFAHGPRLLQYFGKTFLVFLQVGDRDVDFGELGAVSPWWNRREFVREPRWMR